MQRGHHVDLRRQLRRVGRLGHAEVEEGHALESQPRRQRARLLDQFGPRLDAVDVPAAALLEEQVVDDEAEVGLAGAVVGQRGLRAVARQFAQQLLDELEQVVDLLELAARVLVEPAFAREDVQFLEQFDRLARPQFALQLGFGLRGLGGWPCSSRRSARADVQRRPALRRPAPRASRCCARRWPRPPGKASTARLTLSSRSRCSVGYGARLVALVMSSASRAGELEARMEARQLEHALEARARQPALGTRREIVEVQKIGQGVRCDQEGGVAHRTGRGPRARSPRAAAHRSGRPRRPAGRPHSGSAPRTCTALAKGHRFRPITARSSQRRVSASRLRVPKLSARGRSCRARRGRLARREPRRQRPCPPASTPGSRPRSIASRRRGAPPRRPPAARRTARATRPAASARRWSTRSTGPGASRTAEHEQRGRHHAAAEREQADRERSAAPAAGRRHRRACPICAKAATLPSAIATKPQRSRRSGATPRCSSRPPATLPTMFIAAASAVSTAVQPAGTPASA